jgi:C1A family cysteine protease
MMTINNTSTADNSTLINDESKMSFSDIKSSEHLTIPTSEKCDKHAKNSSGSRFSALENESGFSSMSSFIIPSLNEIGLPPNPNLRKEVTFDERQSENLENFNVLWV